MEAPHSEDGPRDRMWVGGIQALGVVIAVQVGLPVLMLLIAPSFFEAQSNVPVLLVWSVGWTQLLYLPWFAQMKKRVGLMEQRKGVFLCMAILFILTSCCNAFFIPLLMQLG